MIKVFVVVGTRPEAIKMAPIIVALRAKREYQVRVCATSQHKEMLQQVFDFFRIKSDFDLQVMEPNQSLSSLTAKILLQLDRCSRGYNYGYGSYLGGILSENKDCPC